MSTNTQKPVTNPSLEQARELSEGDQLVIEHGAVRAEVTITDVKRHRVPDADVPDSYTFTVTDNDGETYKYRVNQRYSRFWQ